MYVLDTPTSGVFRMGRMGDGITDALSSVDPTLLAVGVGLLALVWVLTGKKRKTQRKKRLRSQIIQKQGQLAGL
jgi:hypothetical protein